jgi:3-oxoacyl-[acyl-carrier protein] reductase
VTKRWNDYRKTKSEYVHMIPVALVTGASRGLGRGIALELARRGLSVGVNFAGNAREAETTVRLCEAEKRSPEQRFVALKANVGDPQDRARLLEQTLAAFGRIDVLVNNAGIGPAQRNDVTATTLESFRNVLQVNLEGPFFLTQAVVNYWLSGKVTPALPHGFAVIFNSSISATTASLNRGEYCVSKAALAMVTQLYALRLAAEKINVYELRPGIMATDMTSGVKEKYDKLIDDGVVPQKRWGTGEDVGKAVGALVAGEFAYSTGAVIYLDGGFHMSIL